MFRKILFLLISGCFSVTAFAANPTGWSDIRHIVVIVFENTNATETLKQTYFKSLVSKGAFLSNYYGVTHPSQPNYMALIGGSTFNVDSDNNVNIKGQHLGNLLNIHGKSWRAYAEAYPGNCFLGMTKGTYRRKHVPFLNFTNVSTNKTECEKVVNSSEFLTDLNAKALRQFSLYTPDINNDGHDTNVTYASQYLSNTFGHIFNDASVLKHTLFIITFDEDDYTENNKIYTLLLGAGVKPGATSSTRYDHYSLLKTIESIYNLGTLGRNDKNANVISDVWQS